MAFGELVNLLDQLEHSGHVLGVELLRLGGVEGDTDSAGLGMDAERGLQQVVHTLRDGNIQPETGITE